MVTCTHPAPRHYAWRTCDDTIAVACCDCGAVLTGGHTMNTYWHEHPRGIANDCNIWRAETKEQAAALEAAGFTRLTRDEMRRHVAWVNAENDSWGSNRAFGHIDWREVTNDPAYSAAHFLRQQEEQQQYDQVYR